MLQTQKNPLFVPDSLRRRTTSTEDPQTRRSLSTSSNPPAPANTLRNTFLLKQWLQTYTRIWLHGGVVWPIAFVLWQLLFQRVVDVACDWVYPQLAVRTPHTLQQPHNTHTPGNQRQRGVVHQRAQRWLLDPPPWAQQATPRRMEHAL